MGMVLLSLFPEATNTEIKRTKAYLEQYRKAKKMLETFPSSVSEKQHALIKDIERSFSLILDDEIRAIMEYRYVKGNTHKVTLGYFGGRGLSERTIDRKIEEGIETIANTLLFCGQLETSGK